MGQVYTHYPSCKFILGSLQVKQLFALTPLQVPHAGLQVKQVSLLFEIYDTNPEGQIYTHDPSMKLILGSLHVRQLLEPYPEHVEQEASHA
jgi:hypothetical protein